MTRTMIVACLASGFGLANAQHSVAREWNEAVLLAIRNDLARPTVHARNLYHTSLAMYDAWAAYDPLAKPFLLGRTAGSHYTPFSGVPDPSNVTTARHEAISFAAYRLIRHRFRNSPKASLTFAFIDSVFASFGYDSSDHTTDYANGSPAALGNYVATSVIAFGFQDGSNESSGYANLFYEPVNSPLSPKLSGPGSVADPNRWQPLTLQVFIDQSGNIIPGAIPPFLGPEWGQVLPFSLRPQDRTSYQRDNFIYYVYHDPGHPPYLDTTSRGGMTDEYKWGFELVAVWSGQLDTADGTLIDISPNAIGNIQDLPTTFEEYHTFYDRMGGGDASEGYDVNPRTGVPYESQIVPRGDYARVLAEFWADGPQSETPPGHWFTILNHVNDDPRLEKKFRGEGPILDDLEWDVKGYFALGGAMHDAAVAAWGLKGRYDYVRPITAIRYMASRGQSSDPAEPSYHPAGIRLIPGFIELVAEGDTLAGSDGRHVGKVKLKAWRGPGAVADPATDAGGVDWILAENWWPYQRPTFVTPPFAGYVSGHSTFSRAAAELLTILTGDEFFPGGLGEFVCPENEFLVFEQGPSVPVKLQWAKYRDASDQCSLSRIWGGIHPPQDDIPGRKLGAIIGPQAFAFAETFFNGTASGLTEYAFATDVSNVVIYPNPSRRGFPLSLQLGLRPSDIRVTVYNILGQEIYATTARGPVPGQVVQIPTASLSTGVYLVRATGFGLDVVRKVIIAQ